MTNTLNISLYVTVLPQSERSAENNQLAATAIIENVSDERQTLTAASSDVLRWNIEDDDGNSYTLSHGSLQAPHYLTIEPGKAFRTRRVFDSPASINAEMTDTKLFDDCDRIITDPREQPSSDEELSNPSDYVYMPGVSPSMTEELTVTFSTRLQGSTDVISESVRIVPADLERIPLESLEPDSIPIDDGAALNITSGRSDIPSAHQGFTTPASQYVIRDELEYPDSTQ